MVVGLLLFEEVSDLNTQTASQSAAVSLCSARRVVHLTTTAVAFERWRIGLDHRLVRFRLYYFIRKLFHYR